MSDVIEISDSDDEVIDVDDWVSVDAAAAPRGHAQGRTVAAAAAAQTEEDEDAALARRLQEEEWGQGGGGGVAAAPRADFGGDAPGLDFEESDLDASRRHRREQDAAYEASLAADRRREAEAREKQAAEAAAAASAAAAAAAAAAEAAAAEAALRDAEAMKRQARERWLAAAEPAAGAVGVVNVSLRFSDGARVMRRFDADTTLATLFDAAAALGPLPHGAAFSLAAGFPRRVLTRPTGADGGGTLHSCGLEEQASVMVVAAD